MPTSAFEGKNLESRNTTPTALVAGGAGFIGSHLVSTLISQNFKVICVDNLSTGKKENLKEVLTSPNFTLLEQDINDPKFVLPEGIKIDYCFHLASIEDYLDKGLSLDTLLVNSLGTKQLLEIARENQAKFILVSAADLYGGAISSSSLRYYFGKTPTQESILSAHEAKRFSEALAFEYYKKYKVPLTIIRLKDAYGPRMNLNRGDEISNLLYSALNKETLEIPGDGLRVVNPTFVTDIIFGLIKAAVGEFSGEIFILVNPDKVTLESFAQTVKLVAGPLELEHKKDPDSFDFGNQHFDLENTREKLSWRPKVSLAEGISSVVHQVQIEKSKKEATKVEEPKEEQTHSAKTETKERKGFRVTRFIRPVVFVLAAGLLVITIFYPATSFGINSYLGKGRIERSYQNLLNENNEASIAAAFSAQKNFQKAEAELNNLDWLVKIVGLSEPSAATDAILAASASLAEAIRLSGRGNEILLTSSENPNLTAQGAKDRLNDSLDNLYAAEDRLEESKLGLEELSWKKVPTYLLPTEQFLNQSTAFLDKQVKQLIATIEENLAKSSQNP